MAIKLIHSEPDSSHILYQICPNCGSNMEFISKDITKSKGGSYIICPSCLKIA